MELMISNAVLHAVELAILILLVGLGIGCGVVFARRWRAVGEALAGAKRWRPRLERELSGDGGTQTVPPKIAAHEAGAADRMMRLALANAHLCPESLEKLLETHEATEKEALERGAQFLGTVGANAPFLGLTGTVLGILAAFRKMAESGGGGADVMAAIAGALIATAAGLLVAIPAVVLYNLLKTRIRKTLNAFAGMRDLLLARSLQAAAQEAF